MLHILVRFLIVGATALGVLNVLGLDAKHVTFNTTPSKIEGKAHTEILLRDFMSWKDIDRVNIVLDRAKRRDSIEIVLDYNGGGMVAAYLELREHVIDSKATITVTVKGYAASCGAFFISVGKYSKVSYRSRIMFHQVYDTSSGFRTYDKETVELSVMLAKQSNMTRYMTPSQLQRWKNRQDVWMTGLDYCKRAKRVKFYSDGCVISN